MPATPKKLTFTKEDRTWAKDIKNRELQQELHRRAREEGVDFFDVVEWPIAEPKWLIDGWLVEGMGLLIAGDPKSFKSTLAVQLCWTLATGEPFLGRYEYKGKTKNVLYLHEENTLEDVRRHAMETLNRAGYGTIVQPGTLGSERRFVSSGKERPSRKKFLIRPRTGFTVTWENLEALKDFIEVYDIEYLVLDPLYKIQTEGSGLNDDKAIAHITTNLDRLTEETGCQIILIHHNNKSRDARGGHKIMGNNLIHGWAPQLWQLTKGEEFIQRGETAYRIAVAPDFRSALRHWKQKDLVYCDWQWDEEGQYLPGEKKKAGRRAKPGQVKYIEDYNAGRLDGLTVRQQAEQYGVGAGTINRWKNKATPEEPEEL